MKKILVSIVLIPILGASYGQMPMGPQIMITRDLSFASLTHDHGFLLLKDKSVVEYKKIKFPPNSSKAKLTSFSNIESKINISDIEGGISQESKNFMRCPLG